MFDSLMGMLGVPDPLDEMKAYQARQNQANAGAANAQPGAPGAVGPNGANAAPPVSTLPPGQEPQGTKTPEDMGSIIIDLTRREQAKQGFNQALGMGFGAFAQPRDREAVDKMFNVNPIDATKLGEGLMQINSQQQGQDRTNALLNFVASGAGAKLASDNNMTQEQLVALAKSNPGAIADLQKTLATPSTTMGDVMGMDQWLKAHGATDAERKMYTTVIGTKMMPADVQNMFMATQKYRQENDGKDPPWINDPDAYKTWAKDQEGKSADRAEANKNFDTTNRLMNSLQTQIQDLKTDPGKVSLMQSNQAKKLLAEKLIATDKCNWASIVDAAKATNVVFSPEEFRFLSQLQQMKGEQYAQAIQSLPHNRFSQQEAENMRNSLGQITNLSSFGDNDSYNDQAIDQLNEDVKGFRAGTYGAAQRFKDMPKDLRPYVDSGFLSGGELHVKGSGSEDWEKTDLNKDPDPQDLKDAIAAVKMNPANKGSARRHFKASGANMDKVKEAFSAEGLTL